MSVTPIAPGTPHRASRQPPGRRRRAARAPAPLPAVPLLAVLLAALLCAAPARAQFTRFQAYTDEQGLSDLGVTAILQDDDGYMLFGTEGGLFRYDGQSVRPYEPRGGLPASGLVRQLLRDPAGRTWLVANNALFLRRGRAFARVDPGIGTFAPGAHALAVSGNTVMVNLAGTLRHAALAGTTVGRFVPVFGPVPPRGPGDRPGPVPVPPPAPDGFVVADADGAFLFDCGTALCRLDAANGVHVLGTADGLPAERWRAALRAPDGTLWLRSSRTLAWRRPGMAGFATVAIPGPHDTYLATHEAELELATDSGPGILTQGDDGYLRWDGAGWTAYPHHVGGVPDSAILAFCSDREGSLWLGAVGNGAFRSIGAGIWEHWTRDDGLPASLVWSIARLPSGPRPPTGPRPATLPPTGHIWVTTDGETGPIDRSSPGIPGGNYALSVSRGGRVWMAPFGAPLDRLDPATGLSERFPDIGKVANGTIDRRNRLWLFTDDGVFLVADADAPAAAIHPVRVGTLTGAVDLDTDAAGDAWIAAPEGLFRWRDGAGLHRVLPPAALSGSPFATMLARPDELWVATSAAGILRFRLSGGGATPLPAIAGPAIGARHVQLMHRDRGGRIWIGTDRGIDMLDAHGWRRFDASRGPISNDLSQDAVFEDRDGSLWFGTSRGLSHLIDPAHLPAPLPPRRPQITALSLGGHPVAPAPEVSIRWVPGPLVIRFADLNFAGDRTMRFRYRIDGVDPNWNETGDRVIQYAAPPFGTLSFSLSAFDPALGLGSAPVVLRLHILAPWWYQPSVWWAAAAVALVLLVGAWRVRVRFLLRQQLRLEAMIGARTREIELARQELVRRSGREQQRLEEMVTVRTAEIEDARRELQRLAMSDALTGLPNRRAVMLALEEAMGAATAAGEKLALLLFDIDHFKAINDRFGHPGGDTVLSALGERLRRFLAPGEIAGRYGGEEFMLVLPGNAAAAAARGAQLRAALGAAPFPLGPDGEAVTVSGGLAFLQPSDTVATLVGRADAALYAAKEGGRDRLRSEHDLHAALRSDAALAADAALRHDLLLAIEREEFVLHFQPVIDLASDAVLSCETLLRWQSPARGPMRPAEFIPFAERAGLMPAIDAWVLRAACREATAWPPEVRVSVNVSASQFYQSDLVATAVGILRDTGLHPSRLEIEVTETAMIVDIGAAAVTLGRLRELGVSVALDDFGTGYSSLSFLRDLPFDRIKIDRAFIRDLDANPDASAIVRGVIQLCTGIGAAVTVEGVETPEQVAFLRGAGCGAIQGYGISPPAPAAEIRCWMRSYAASRPRPATLPAAAPVAVLPTRAHLAGIQQG